MAKLYFYYSAMNAGKSTVLLQSSYNYNERGMDTLLYTPSMDTRFGFGMISSRIGLNAKAIPFHRDYNLYQNVKERVASNPNIKCVLVDEAQFLTKTQVKQLTEIVDTINIPVLAYGLRSDFRAEPFEGSMYLLILADNLVELKTICHCGRKAMMNARMDDRGNIIKVGDQIQIGGNERYIAMCRRHYNDESTGNHQDEIYRESTGC